MGSEQKFSGETIELWELCPHGLKERHWGIDDRTIWSSEGQCSGGKKHVFRKEISEMVDWGTIVWIEEEW